MIDQDTAGPTARARRWPRLRSVSDAVRSYLGCQPNVAERTDFARSTNAAPSRQADAIAAAATDIFETLHALSKNKKYSNEELLGLATRLMAEAAERAVAGQPAEVQRIGEQLGGDTRRIFDLHVSRGLTYHQVAQEFALPPRAALGILVDAYLQLRRRPP